MKRNKAIPGLASIVGKRLKEWQAGDTLSEVRSQDNRIETIIADIDNLGWDKLCFGLVPKSWTNYQHEYLQSIGRRTPGLN